MNKKLFLLFAVVLLGCSYEGQTLGDYLSDPRSIIKDPHFSDYKKQRNDLESQYLRKEIDYSEYVEKMDTLDNKYSKEVEKRNEIFSK